jgi:hypothetical protein
MAILARQVRRGGQTCSQFEDAQNSPLGFLGIFEIPAKKQMLKNPPPIFAHLFSYQPSPFFDGRARSDSADPRRSSAG